MKRPVLTLLCLLLCLSAVRAQSAEQKKATIAYLQGLQTADGGFLPAKPKDGQEAKPSLRATSSALRALKYFGGEARDLPACFQFVQNCFDRASGGFADQPGGKPDVTTTAIGIMAVAELKLPADRYNPSAVKYLLANAKTFEEIRIGAAGIEATGKVPAEAAAWLEQVAKLRNPDGSYGKGDGVARDTGGAVVIVLRLGGKVENPDQVVKTLKAGQRADGGYGKEGAAGSDLETTYRVLRAFVMLKEKPDTDRCQAFVAKCRNDDGGYGVAPGQPSTVSGTYFAGIIQHWLAER